MSRIASLSDMRKKEDDSKKKQGQEYYAGGMDGHGGGSGVSVMGPPGSGGNPMDSIVQAASQAGGGGAATGGGGPLRTITFYRDCFQVDDGPIRPVSDPENKKFLDEVSKGYCPKELQDGKGNAPEISLVDKRSEDPPKAAAEKFNAFRGEGVSLGGTSQVSSGDSTVFEVRRVASCVEVSPSKPKTRVRVKLPNGKAVVGNFNKFHTVNDLMEFVNVNVTGVKMYQLLSGRPPKPIENNGSITLDAAGLCGASVTVKVVS